MCLLNLLNGNKQIVFFSAFVSLVCEKILALGLIFSFLFHVC